MTIHFPCEHCKHPMIAPEELFGRRAVCPQCKSTINVPEPENSSVGDFHVVRDGWKVDDGSADSNEPSRVFRAGPPVGDLGDGFAASQTTISSPESDSDLAVRQDNASLRDFSPLHSPSIPENVAITTGPVVKPSHAEPGTPVTQSADALWYVRPSSGGQFGPASMTLLRQWKTEGRVTGDSWVWQQGWEDWQHAAVVFPDLKESAPELLVNPKVAGATPKTVSRSAYLKARRKRSALVTIGLSLGTIIVAALVLLLFYVLRGQGGV